MKGPSLDAIRKFKQQQEQRKREEDAKRVEDKLSTLQHRAAQGDKKAKGLLKKIENSKQGNNRNSDNVQINHHRDHNSSRLSNDRYSTSSRDVNQHQKNNAPKRKPINAAVDFDELMRLAQSNNNEIIRKVEPKEIPKIKRVRQISDTAREPSRDSTKNLSTSNREAQLKPPARPVIVSEPSASTSRSAQPSRQQQQIRTYQALRHGMERPRPAPGYDRLRPAPGHDRPRHVPDHGLPRPSHGDGRSRFPMRQPYGEDDYYDCEEEDEYESDGFVVDEDEDGAQAELSKTLKDIFHYDKRRADLREQEVERHYRAIGNVSTFEDLEREERRASRLATAEDAREARLDEERKRQKKIRLRGLR